MYIYIAVKETAETEEGEFSTYGIRCYDLDSGNVAAEIRDVFCDKRLAELNDTLRREAQVRGKVEDRADGGVTVTLTLDDETGNLMTLSLFSGSREQASSLVRRFRHRPEAAYNGILSLLRQLEDPEDASR